MNDFLRTMGQFGMEGLGIEAETPVSLEQEMNDEIAMEAELDEAYAQMDFASIVASTSQCEAILSVMAEREVGLESNAGRDAATIYGEFGLEAIKDVAMRKAYSGVASLKALINTCISWLKQLLGIHTASKKIFSGLKKKAKAMGKQLGKVQSKVSEKLKRDMPGYEEALKKLVTLYSGLLDISKEHRDTFNFEQDKADLLNMSEQEYERAVNELNTANEHLKEALERINDKEAYDPKDTEEYEGSTCYATIKSAVKYIETFSDTLKTDDFAKIIDKNIKNLEKLRKDLDKDKKNPTPPQAGRLLNKTIEAYTKTSSGMKRILKEIVKASDDCLTMAKGIYATLV